MNDIDRHALEIHRTAVEHGFWPPEGRNLGEMLMLVVTEVAEALEEDREGRGLLYWKCTLCDHRVNFADEMSDGHKVYGYKKGIIRRLLVRINFPVECDGAMKPEGVLVEIADAIIRLFDTGHEMASHTAYTLNDIITMKMAYNNTRAHKHGKAY